MTAKQMEKSFAEAEARRPSYERLSKLLKAQAAEFKKHPEKGLQFMVEAGIWTPTGRLTKPYRTMIKEDKERAEKKAQLQAQS